MPGDAGEGCEEGEGKAGPRRAKAEQVPLGIRRPRSPDFDPLRHQDRQACEDEERDREVLRRAEEQPLVAPDKHRDYKIRDGDDLDRHLEDICSHNALIELIARAKEEVEHELDVRAKPFRGPKMDELCVFAKEAIIAMGEEQGFEALRAHVKELVYNDVIFAQQELDRKKEAYMKLTGK